MRSRAAIGNHPIHPFLVALPVGAFFLALIGDVAYLRTRGLPWADLSGFAIGVGVLTALVAALFGFIDYTGLAEGSAARRIGTAHMALNLAQVALYGASFYLRFSNPTRFLPTPAALALAFVAFALLLAAGWLGGKMVFELRAGVIESDKTIEARR